MDTQLFKELIHRFRGLELMQKLARKYESGIKLNNDNGNNWHFGLLTDYKIIEEVTINEDQLEDNQNIISLQRSVTNNDAINTLNTAMIRVKKNKLMN